MKVRGRHMLIIEDETASTVDLRRHLAQQESLPVDGRSGVAADEASYENGAARGYEVPRANGEMARQGARYVAMTGFHDGTMRIRSRESGHLSQPVDNRAIFDALVPRPATGWREEPNNDIVSILPKLRLAARLLLEGGEPGDRLVEMTLELAVSGAHLRDPEKSLETWLSELLEETHRRLGRTLLL